jgi:hypothetical protein
MLAEFQQAMADLVASVARVQAARADPEAWLGGYDLTEAERGRLAGFLAQPGLALGCMVYRANRLAPVAMHLTELCRAIGPALRGVMDDFWAAHPHSEPNPLIECARFCDFLDTRPDMPRDALAQARATIAEALAASAMVIPAPSALPPAPPSAPSSPSGSAAPAAPAPARWPRQPPAA